MESLSFIPGTNSHETLTWVEEQADYLSIYNFFPGLSHLPFVGTDSSNDQYNLF